MKRSTKNLLQPIYWLYRFIKLVCLIAWYITGVIGFILHESAFYTTIKTKTWVSAQEKIKVVKLEKKYSDLVKTGKQDEAAKVLLKIHKLKHGN